MAESMKMHVDARQAIDELTKIRKEQKKLEREAVSLGKLTGAAAQRAKNRLGQIQKAWGNLNTEAAKHEKVLGRVGRAGNKMNGVMMQMSFAADDLSNVLAAQGNTAQGWAAAIRSIGNNVSTATMVLHPLAGLFTGIGVAIASSAIPKFFGNVEAQAKKARTETEKVASDIESILDNARKMAGVADEHAEKEQIKKEQEVVNNAQKILNKRAATFGKASDKREAAEEVLERMRERGVGGRALATQKATVERLRREEETEEGGFFLAQEQLRKATSAQDIAARARRTEKQKAAARNLVSASSAAIQRRFEKEKAAGKTGEEALAATQKAFARSDQVTKGGVLGVDAAREIEGLLRPSIQGEAAAKQLGVVKKDPSVLTPEKRKLKQEQLKLGMMEDAVRAHELKLKKASPTGQISPVDRDALIPVRHQIEDQRAIVRQLQRMEQMKALNPNAPNFGAP